MPLPKRSLVPLTALVLLALASLAAAAEAPQTVERRVFVVRAEGQPEIDLQAEGAERGFLGVGLIDLTPELRRHFGVPEDHGVMISKVLDDSPAARAGLRPADILTTVDGEPLLSPVALSMRVARARQGDRIALELWRNGRATRREVPLDVRRRAQLDISPLIRRRGPADGPIRWEFRGSGGSGDEEVWIEEVAGTVGDTFDGATFIQQLEALRQERATLLAKLAEMEGRLGELEAELRRLDRAER